MTHDYKRIKEIFHGAADLTGDVREAFLDQACGDDATLRQEVESLLAHDVTGPAPSDTPIASRAMWENAVEPERLPETIGPYRIVRELGRGGMGVVYTAVRDDDRFKRRAAVKVLKRGMDSTEIIKRFELERQVLSALNHVNIARLFDAGTTEDGRPYFAMEYVEGLPINEYCDRNRLSITERLQLFQKVCSAVHYAHQNLVVHRDLKPTNIIVSRDGEPKLLDFGIAKLINPGLAAFGDDPTAPEMRIMTPEYASPEQVRGDPITTASDVYSLGVLMYEMVSGHRPYRLKSRGRVEVEQVVCDTDPDKPSTAISKIEAVDATAVKGDSTRTITPETVGKLRDTNPDRLRRRIAGDIDNIVLKAMRKEAHRRYASAEQLSEDIDRHLSGLPVIARKDTLGYRCIKFVRRNRIGVAAGVLVVAGLTLGLVGATWGWGVARGALADADDARRAEASVGTALLGMQKDFVGVHSDVQTGRPLIESLAAALESVIPSLDALGPENRRARIVMASTYDKIGELYEGKRNPGLRDMARAEMYYGKALAIREELATTASVEDEVRRGLYLSHVHFGDLAGHAKDSDAALTHYQQALRHAEEIEDPDGRRRACAIALLQIGDALKAVDEQTRAADYYRRSYVLRRERYEEDPQSDERTFDLIVGARRYGTADGIGEYEVCVDLCLEAAGLCSTLLERSPRAPRYVLFRAESYWDAMRLANTHDKARDVLTFAAHAYRDYSNYVGMEPEDSRVDDRLEKARQYTRFMIDHLAETAAADPTTRTDLDTIERLIAEIDRPEDQEPIRESLAAARELLQDAETD